MKLFCQWIWIFAFGCLAVAQVRIISHIPRLDGGFESHLVMVNPSDQVASAQFSVYAANGEYVGDKIYALQPETTMTVPIEGLFTHRDDYSHLRISDTAVTYTIVYRSQANGAGRAHVPEDRLTAKTWRIFAGDQDVTWDGIAFVNMGLANTNVVATAYAADGQELGQLTLAEALVPMGKGLSLLSDAFDGQAVAWYDIKSDLPLAVTSLRGDQGGSRYLWENKAISLAFNRVVETRVLAQGLITVPPWNGGPPTNVADLRANGNFPTDLPNDDTKTRLVFEFSDPQGEGGCQCNYLGETSLRGQFSSSITVSTNAGLRSLYILPDRSLDLQPNFVGYY